MSNEEYKKMIVDAEKTVRRNKLEKNKRNARNNYKKFIDQTLGYTLLLKLYGNKLGIYNDRQFAEKLGMSAQQFNRIKKSDYIGNEKLVMICIALNIKPADYFSACDPCNPLHEK